MGPILWEWLSMSVRWLHVIAGIAWIGSSFYFVHLDSSLKQRQGLPEGAGGEAWQVHGGGFYHMIKYLVAPAQMPDSLTWFKWEAYATWLSGMGLLIIVYYFGAQLYLIDLSVLDLPVWGAVLISVARPDSGLAGLRPAVQVEAGRERHRAVRGAVRVPARARLRVHLRLQRPRRHDADGCPGRHDDGGQRRHGDHSQPAHRGGGPAGRAGSPTLAWVPPPSSARCTTTI